MKEKNAEENRRMWDLSSLFACPPNVPSTGKAYLMGRSGRQVFNLLKWERQCNQTYDLTRGWGWGAGVPSHSILTPSKPVLALHPKHHGAGIAQLEVCWAHYPAWCSSRGSNLLWTSQHSFRLHSPKTLSDENINQGLVCAHMHSIPQTQKILTFMS